jgi:flagellar hook assembly protein FlgD
MIRFLLPKQSHVEIAIYNALGQPIRRLIAKDYPAGTHAVAWDGRDDTNAAMASGIYFYHIQSKDFTAIRKMMLLR